MDFLARPGQKAEAKSASGGGLRKCQVCLETSHWTYECKNKRKTLIGESRSKILKQRVVETEKGQVKIVAPPPQQAAEVVGAKSDSEDVDSSDSEVLRARKRKKNKKKHKKVKRVKRSRKDASDSSDNEVVPKVKSKHRLVLRARKRSRRDSSSDFETFDPLDGVPGVLQAKKMPKRETSSESDAPGAMAGAKYKLGHLRSISRADNYRIDEKLRREEKHRRKHRRREREVLYN